jgi:hypothetical protein
MSLCPRLSWFLPIVSETVPVWGYIPPNATLRKRIPHASRRGPSDSPYLYLGECQDCPSLRTSTEHRSSIFSLEGGLEGLPLRVSNEGLPIPYTSLKGSGQGCPLLRASSDHSFTVGALRARRAPGRSLPILLSVRVPRARGRSGCPSHPYLTNCQETQWGSIISS